MITWELRGGTLAVMLSCLLIKPIIQYISVVAGFDNIWNLSEEGRLEYLMLHVSFWNKWWMGCGTESNTLPWGFCWVDWHMLGTQCIGLYLALCGQKMKVQGLFRIFNSKAEILCPEQKCCKQALSVS